MRRLKTAWGIVLVLVVLIAGGYVLFLRKPPSGSGNREDAEGVSGLAPAVSGSPKTSAEPAPLPVKAVTALRRDLIITLKSPGEAYTERKAVLKAEAGGVIKSLPAREGLRVRKGDVLAEIDDAEYRLSLDKLEALRLKYLSELHLEKQFAAADDESSPEAQAGLTKAQADHEAALAAFQAGKITAADLEKASRDYELALIAAGRKKEEIIATTKGLTGAEIDVKTARLILEKTVIRAPFSGILTDFKVSPGERIESGREICTIVDLSRMKVKARVLESDIGKMMPGRGVDLRFSAYPGRVFKGLVESVGPIVDAEDKRVRCSSPWRVGRRDQARDARRGRDRGRNPSEPPPRPAGRHSRPGRPETGVRRGTGFGQVAISRSAWKTSTTPKSFGNDAASGISEGDTVIVEGHFTWPMTRESSSGRPAFKRRETPMTRFNIIGSTPVRSQLAAAGCFPGLGHRSRCARAAGSGGTDIELDPPAMPDTALRENLALSIERLNPAMDALALKEVRERYLPQFELTYQNGDTNTPGTWGVEGSDIASSFDSVNLGLVQSFPWGTSLSLGVSSAMTDTTRSFSLINPSYFSSVRLDVRQPLLRGFGSKAANVEGIKAARAVEMADASVRAAAAQTAFEVEAAYWNLVLARENLKVQESSLASSRQILDRNREAARIGTESGIGVLNAETEVARYEDAVLAASRAVQSQEDLLRKLLRLPAGGEAGIIPLDRPEIEIREVSAADVLRAALANRPEMDLARRRIDNSRSDVDYFRNQSLPKVDLNFSFWSPGISGVRYVYQDDNPLSGVVIGGSPAAGAGQLLRHPRSIRIGA